MTGIASLDVETLLYAADLVLILIAFFLLIRLRRPKKKSEPEKEKPAVENQSGLAGIADLKPGEFNLERLEMKKQDLISAGAKPSDSGAGLNIGAAVKNEPSAKLPEQAYPGPVSSTGWPGNIETKPQVEKPVTNPFGLDTELKIAAPVREELKGGISEKTQIPPGAGLKAAAPGRSDLELEDELPEEITEMPAGAGGEERPGEPVPEVTVPEITAADDIKIEEPSVMPAAEPEV